MFEPSDKESLLNGNQLDPREEAANNSNAQQVCHDKREDHHRHGPEEAIRTLLAAAARLAGGNAALCFGRSSQREFPAALERELRALREEPVAPAPQVPLFAEGGEHRVYGTLEDKELIKHTLPGTFGRIMDERSLLDPRTFLSRPKLIVRGALPSEYLRRWAIMADVFGMVTTYLRRVHLTDLAVQMAVTQVYIVEQADDPTTPTDIAEFFAVHGFERVKPELIVNPEVQHVTWYRQRHGILVTDAHARNFRKDTEGVLFPIDLVIALVPAHASTLLPIPRGSWKPSLN